MLLNAVKMHKHTAICTGILILLSFFGCFMIVLRKVIIGEASYVYLAWNLFLSWIPFVLSVIMSYLYTAGNVRSKGFFILVLGAFWLLFYPNAPYMITDFIHFQDYNSFLVWYDLVIYSLFVWTGFLLGFISLYLVYRIVAKTFSILSGWIFVLFVLFLSSYGVYLGRFIRWNSWDIIKRPVELLHSVLDNLNYKSVVFSMIFGMLLTLTYGFLYSLTYLSLEKIEPQPSKHKQ